MSDSDIDEVIEAIKKKYVLTEKNFNLEENIYKKELSFVENVVSQVGGYFDLAIDLIKSKKRTANLVKARYIVFKICKDLPEEKISSARTGLVVGNRSHCTVLHGLKMFEDMHMTDFEFRRDYNAIKRKVEQSLKL